MFIFAHLRECRTTYQHISVHLRDFPGLALAGNFLLPVKQRRFEITVWAGVGVELASRR